MKFSLPYISNILSYFRENENYLHKVNDVFFSDDSIFPSSRKSPLRKEHWEELSEIHKNYGIQLNYVLNPTVWENSTYSASGKIRILKNLDTLKKNNVSIITLNNTLLLNDPVIRKALSVFTLKNSVNNMITSLDQVMFFVEDLGIKSIFLGRDINRNLDEIKKISSYAKKEGVVLHALVNEFCLNRCPYKFFCDSIISQAYKDSEDFNSLNNKRKTLSCGDDWPLKKYLKSAVIYPRQVEILGEYVDIFKIGGRLNDLSRLRPTLDAYLLGKDVLLTQLINQKVSFDKLRVSDIPEFYFSKTLNCKSLCRSCNFCESILEGS